ncbi:tRNA(Met) cytidine acetyltransferase TmcA [Marinobacter caseinilyticus]|uniref:tRNA(Met) cytidine acetyltransferase TmcA n=1 Tax=Marinobacter caseinilyticus TaxID=2692195 RepID=UPI0014082A95|nr:GNAT family N-acetyltransferase [Marinobacter caseinilyticus]
MSESTPSTPSWRSLQQALHQSGERRLVVLEGDRELALARLAQWLPGLTIGTGLWSGPSADCPHPDLIPVKPDEGQRWLGRQTDLLVWDGWQGNPPGSLAAFSGTLGAGGLWFWLMPALAQWRAFKDPDYARTGLDRAAEHPFAGRMAAVIAADPTVVRVAVDTAVLPILPTLPATLTARAFRSGGTADQNRAVAQILRTGQGRRRRPLVITADRGRGKSAALGMAAVALMRAGREQILVTAPSFEAVSTLFHHARIAAGDDGNLSESGHTLQLGERAQLRFYPTDELLRRRPDAGVVLVDEAAAIPAPLLKAILLAWPRVVFASTIHGYEGSGRGFDLRFRQVLNRETPHWQSLRLAQPIRWADSDPLEALVNRLYLLDADSGTDAARDRAATVDAAIAIERWAPSQAAEPDLSDAFGLLVDAHYRTTPGDLRQWLDDPASVSWVARRDGRIVAVLWLTEEGGLAPALAEQVAQGKRRLRGHLLPQSLANHSGFPEAATLRVGRIVRLAVAEHERRGGLGRLLVDSAWAYAAAQGLEGLGTSFGASPDLLAFWQRCQLPVVRLGLHRDASSGEYAVQLLAGLEEAGRGLVERLRARLSEHWQTLLPACWPTLAPALVLQLTAQLPDVPDLSNDDHRELASFCDGFRGFEMSLLPLRRLTRQTGMAQRLAISDHASLWCRAVLQGWSWQDLQTVGACEGRRQGERRLRALTSELLAACDASST